MTDGQLGDAVHALTLLVLRETAIGDAYTVACLRSAINSLGRYRFGRAALRQRSLRMDLRGGEALHRPGYRPRAHGPRLSRPERLLRARASASSGNVCDVRGALPWVQRQVYRMGFADPGLRYSSGTRLPM